MRWQTRRCRRNSSALVSAIGLHRRRRLQDFRAGWTEDETGIHRFDCIKLVGYILEFETEYVDSSSNRIGGGWI